MDRLQGQITGVLQNLQTLSNREREYFIKWLKKSIKNVPTSQSNSTGSTNEFINTEAVPAQIAADHDSAFPQPLQRKQNTNTINRRLSCAVLTLACPICGLKSNNWSNLSNHLHTGHSSSVISVCRRCHGIFRTRALLLAHECFEWGRKNLPCTTIYSSVHQSPMLKMFGFPSAGVYLERRCGLCLTSTTVYTNYEHYERHKHEEHANSGPKTSFYDIERPKNVCFKGPQGAHFSKSLKRRKKCDLNTISTDQVVPTHSAKQPTFLQFNSTGNNNLPNTNQSPSSATDELPESELSLSDNVGKEPTVVKGLDKTVCQICKLSFRTVERLLLHQKTSILHARKLKRFLQNNRSKTGSSSRIDQSDNPDASAIRIFTCPDCNLTYGRKQALKRHVTLSHRGECIFNCEYCDFRVWDRTAFKEHMARHFHLKNHACKQCSFRCINKSELTDHVLFKHQDKRQFVCEKCSKTFKTRGTLSRHKKTHSSPTYACNKCQTAFNRHSNLKRHVLLVHANPTKQHKSRKHKPITKDTVYKLASSSTALLPKTRLSKQTTAQDDFVNNAADPIIAPSDQPSNLNLSHHQFIQMSQLSSPEQTFGCLENEVYFITCKSGSNVSQMQAHSTGCFGEETLHEHLESTIPSPDLLHSRARTSDELEMSSSFEPNDNQKSDRDVLNSILIECESSLPESNKESFSVLPCVSNFLFRDQVQTSQSHLSQLDSDQMAKISSSNIAFSSSMLINSYCNDQQTSTSIWRPASELLCNMVGQENDYSRILNSESGDFPFQTRIDKCCSDESHNSNSVFLNSNFSPSFISDVHSLFPANKTSNCNSVFDTLSNDSLVNVFHRHNNESKCAEEDCYTGLCNDNLTPESYLDSSNTDLLQPTDTNQIMDGDTCSSRNSTNFSVGYLIGNNTSTSVTNAHFSQLCDTSLAPISISDGLALIPGGEKFSDCSQSTVFLTWNPV